MKKIAVVSPGCWGDCINSTIMFKPIKDHYGHDCQLDIFTSTKYHTAFINNPHINNLYQTDVTSKNDALNLVHVIKPIGYDLVINSHPMINKTWSSNLNRTLGENLILAWVNCLEYNNIPYTLPLKSDLILTPHERSQADAFMSRISKGKGYVLMECEGESGQSFWNPIWTRDVILTLTKMGYITLVSCIGQRDLITSLQLQTANKAIWVGSASIRTVAGIYDNCDAFISVSSGLSNACNTQQRRKVKHWFEVINSLTCSSNVVGTTEYKTFWHKNDVNEFCEHLTKTL